MFVQEYVYPSSAERSKQRNTFFTTLFRDDRDSRYITAQVKDGAWNENSVSFGALANAFANDGSSSYVSINGFCGNTRRADQARQIHALFFDIDAHAAPNSRESVKTVLEIIHNAVIAGTLPRPTILVDSGRGVHVYYVLNNAIPLKTGGNRADKTLKFYSDMQRRIGALLQALFAGTNYVEIDENVYDLSRVARVPGTFNMSSGTCCELVDVSENFYTLNQLAAKVPRLKTKPNQGQQFTRRANSGLHERRLSDIKLLQSIRNNDCEGSRECMCFVFYNTATQIFDSEMARQQLRSFNAAFKAPLSESEIRNTIKSVDTCVNVRGEQGYYILSLKRITEMLSISDEEADKLNFLISKRRSDRLKAKQKTASKRAERDALIIKLATDTTKTHLEIAEEVECSLRTVASVLKQAGLTKVRSEKITERSTKKTQFTKCKKVATLSKVLGQYCLKPIKTFTFGIKPAENNSTIWKLGLPHSRISVSNGGLRGSKEFRFLRNFGFQVSLGFSGVP